MILSFDVLLQFEQFLHWWIFSLKTLLLSTFQTVLLVSATYTKKYVTWPEKKIKLKTESGNKFLTSAQRAEAVLTNIVWVNAKLFQPTDFRVS